MADVGAGESLLVEHLLEQGYKDITLVVISSKALEDTKKRLGTKGADVTFVAADIRDFLQEKRFDLWHDRAALHYLSSPNDARTYAKNAAASIKNDGILVVAAFSPDGPTKCSGIEIQQYDAKRFEKIFSGDFTLLESTTHLHTTPWGAQQEFIYGVFQRR